MPWRRLDQPTVPAVDDTPAPAPVSGGGWRRLGEPASAPASAGESDSSSFPVGASIAGGAALAGAALLAHNSNTPTIIKKGLEGANALRQQLMLSGFAPLKSLLGNVGAAIADSAETRSLTPLKEFLSMDTVNDAKAAFKAGGSTIQPTQGMTLPGPLSWPGRIMGSIDEATQKAMQRAGMTPDQAQRSVFQQPLTGPLAEGFKDNPVMDYLFPFRRTPINQFTEGLKAGKAETLRGETDIPVLAGYAAAGAAHGALTKDEKYPLSIPLGISLAARYGLPYGVSAIAGRLLAGGKGAGNTAGSVLPVSEYGLGQSIEEPLAPFTKPAALTALQKLTGK